MNEKILKRIIKKTNILDIDEALVDRISFPDLQSLLLEVYRRKVKNLTCKNLFNQYKTNRFVQPSSIKPQEILQFDLLAYSLLPKSYEVMELSPVSPLGSCSLIAPVDQNNVLATIRNTEVSSDSTNLLALECSQRREKLLKNDQKNTTRIKLCASQRLLRTQPFDEAASVPHFKILGLCTAGRDEGSYIFEIETLEEQLSFFIELLLKAKAVNITIASIRIVLILIDSKISEKANGIVENLKEKYPYIHLEIAKIQKKQRYYSTLRYNIFATNSQGKEYFLCDGGFTDWTQQLLQNRKERYLISGFGTERLFLVYK